MNENKLPLDDYDNTDSIATTQTYSRSAGTSTGDRIARTENPPTISRQPDAHSTSTSTDNPARDKNPPTISRQPDGSTSKGISPVLARVLTGGLIGLTLGTLAGAFANKKTAKAVNNAAKGVGEGAKTVAEGVNHSAKGVGDVVKSVAEGVNYAVIGAVESLKDSAEDVEQSTVDAIDAVKDTAENTKQFAVDAVKDTAENTKQFAVGAVDAIKDTAEDAKQSTVGVVDAIKDTADNVKPFEAQNFKLDETQMPDILVVVETEGLIDEIIPVDAEMPVFLDETGFLRGDGDRPESY